jgi:hypothetical protein
MSLGRRLHAVLVSSSIIRGWQLICLGVVVLMVVLLASCFSDVRRNRALVWTAGELICFSPENLGNEVPTLHALELYDVSSLPSKAVWSFYLSPDEGYPAPGKDCLPYGVVPDGAKSYIAAERLEIGRIYEVHIMLIPRDYSVCR